MRLSNLETKKSILIVVLLLLSVIQMGILWSEKSGVPFPFSIQAGKNNSPDLNESRKNYFRPEKILINEGHEDAYWLLESKSGLYRSVWRDIRDSYLKQIVQLKPGISEQTWESITTRRSIIIHFKNPIPAGIIRWMTGADTGSALREIHKIAILPSEAFNNNENALYVLDGQTVYKFVVKIEQGYMKKEEYRKAIDTIRENDSIIPMTRFVIYYPSVKDEDLLVCLEDKEIKIWDLLVQTPDEIAVRPENIDKIQEYLLDEFKGSMVPKWSEDGTNIIFSDPEQVIRFYQGGLFDYQYRNKEFGDKGLVEQAFETALNFIEPRRKNLVEGAGIYLTEALDEPNRNYYVFTFDYVMDDMEIKLLGEQDKKIKPALVITANKDRVLEAKWYIRTFSYNDYSDHYSLEFFNFYDNQLLAEYPEIEDKSIIDISTCYLCPENRMRAEPYWLVETDQKSVYLRMKGKGE